MSSIETPLNPEEIQQSVSEPVAPEPTVIAHDIPPAEAPEHPANSEELMSEVTTISCSDTSHADDHVSADRGRFVFIRIVTTPFQYLIQNLSSKKSTQPSDANPTNSLAVRKTALSPSVTHLELKERGGDDGGKLRKKFPWSLLLIVILPTLFAFIYFGFMASDQYESTAEYVIKTQGGGDASSGLAGIMGAMGMGGGHGDSGAAGDSAMVEAYVESDQILRDLSKEIDLRAIYCSQEIDWISRLKSTPDFFQLVSARKSHRTTDQEISAEDLLSYWKKKVKVTPGDAPGTSTLTVLAFTPQDAKTIAEKVIQLGESLVNHVSERSMKDAVVFAQKEVNLAHDRAMKAFDDLQQFQTRAKQVDPQGFAKARSEIQGKLEGQLSSTQAQMEALRQSLPDEAPGIQQMRTQISALQEQLMVEKNQSTSGRDGKSAAEVINEFGKRQLETEFASKDYLSALTALESARITANRQNRYLEAFDLPELPDKPSLPKRWYDIATVFAFCLLLWGVLNLFIAGVKEHQH
jgi:capsular polysaccharide transport system permease protein